MYFLVKTVLRNLLLPPASPLLVGLLGLILLRKHLKLGVALIIVSQVSMFLLSTPLLAEPLVHLTEHYPALDLAKKTDAQAVVIIGGGGQRSYAPEYAGPAPNYVLLARLAYGAFVARRTALPVLVSGARDEAPVMQTSLRRDFAIEPRWVDDQSNDTFENANVSYRILGAEGIKKIILVTMSTHMYRATQEFRAVGFDVTPAPSGVWMYRPLGVWRYIPNADSLTNSRSAVYELIGEFARRIQAALKIREYFDTKAVPRWEPL